MSTSGAQQVGSQPSTLAPKVIAAVQDLYSLLMTALPYISPDILVFPSAAGLVWCECVCPGIAYIAHGRGIVVLTALLVFYLIPHAN